ncbi:MAG: 4-demethylwyosine synthase TYW1 [Thermoplasmata archaeon]|nr:4-demethylwyosine synthase TYW1 [Thermoplasmata archaeon]
MNDDTRNLLRRQGYKLVGEHSGAKLCHWLRQKLLYDRACYKEHFYGIKSHRCLQMTPTIDQCNLNCLFCWRAQNFSGYKMENADEAGIILDRCISAQKEMTSGFKGDKRCNLEYWKEAQEPNQVAISLSGEPTFYTGLGEFIETCHKRGMTTFLVTNGTTPKVLEKLSPLPTQLYITLAAPNREVYKRLCAPMSHRAWDLLTETLELLPSLNARTVIRHTLIEGWNMGWEDEYAKLDLMANPDFIEPKGYVFVGSSRMRMKIENMPSHQNVKDFSSRLSKLTGYDVLDERKESRVVLLGDRSRERMIGRDCDKGAS